MSRETTHPAGQEVFSEGRTRKSQISFVSKLTWKDRNPFTHWFISATNGVISHYVWFSWFASLWNKRSQLRYTAAIHVMLKFNCTRVLTHSLPWNSSCPWEHFSVDWSCKHFPGEVAFWLPVEWVKLWSFHELYFCSLGQDEKVLSQLKAATWKMYEQKRVIKTDKTFLSHLNEQNSFASNSWFILVPEFSVVLLKNFPALCAVFSRKAGKLFFPAKRIFPNLCQS